MRPRMDPAVRYVPCPEGVYLYGDRGARTMRGARAYEWLSRLEPYLTGELSLAELTADLPAAQRSTVEDMVTLLHEHGFVTDARADLPHTLSPTEMRSYAREIAFLACAIDSPEQRFQRHREARVTVLGAAGYESVTAAVVVAGLRSGWADVRVHCAESAVAELIRRTDQARRDERQRVLVVAEAAGPMDSTAADVVLHIAGTFAEAQTLARACAGVALGQLVIGAEEAWTTEVGDPEDTAVRTCWRRLRAARAQVPVSGPNRWLTGPVPAVLAADLVLGCFRHRTGLAALPAPGPSGPQMTRTDLRTLDMSTHRVVSDAPVDTAEGLLAAAADLVDEYTGVITYFGEGALPQFPLALCRAVIPAREPFTQVFGWGSDRREARVRTLLRALAVHGWLASGGGSDAPHIPAGVAAGLTRAAAIEWGLRQQCEALLRARRPLWAAEPAGEVGRALLDEAGSRLLDQLEVAGCPPRVVDLGGVLGIPAYAVRAGTTAEVVSCAASAQDALRDGLERALLAWQGHAAECCAARVDATEDSADLLDKALREAGFRPLAVDLDGDVTVTHALRVVLDAA